MEKSTVSNTPDSDIIPSEDFEPGLDSTSKSTLKDDMELPKWQLMALSISICCGLFLSLLDTTIVAAGLFTIGQDFGDLESLN
ncbi:hypothetical protein HYALB_00009557 [Hymenoscyphus albidus]|uniref:Uncharacterized protein n=1 Tax=Hymenoscyphus albidus TaxID=595503 RepID=A0A9N9Q572_9HELO|nr:hypothetical protein HYALB_00009557 [Hymenoscyphus albidus]